ncbi:winged helix-turn-helix transcriptional regulator [Sinomonas atrocyanea]|jgi:DNA-binding IclR family transcriptional regulator
MEVLSVAPIRAEILRNLAWSGRGSTAAEIAERVGADYKTAWAHLKALGSRGVVAIDRSDGSRGGPVYRLRREVLEGQAAEVLRYMLGS